MRTSLAGTDKKDYLCYAILRLRADTKSVGRVDSNLPICEQKQRNIFFSNKMRTSLRYSNISAYLCNVFKGQTFTKNAEKKS